MSKQISSLESSGTVKLASSGCILDTTSAAITAVDLTLLSGSWVTLQAFTSDCDVYLVHAEATPTAAPVLVASAVGTAAVGRRIFTSQDKDFFIPLPQGASKVWLVAKATAVASTLRVLSS